MSQPVDREQLRYEITNLLDDLKVNYDITYSGKDGVILATCTDGAITITLANAASIEDLT